jgi:hypothetical protein
LAAAATWVEVVWVQPKDRDWSEDQDRPGKYVPKSEHRVLARTPVPLDQDLESAIADGKAELAADQAEAEALILTLCPPKKSSANPYPDRGSRYSAILSYFGFEGLGNQAA